MFNLPHGRNEWIVAIASALAGFFFGGAAIALVTKLLKELFGIEK
jgi:hypothetical protein